MAIPGQLGLTVSPDTVTYIFVGETEDGEVSTSWYEFDHVHNKPIPIREDALVGFISNLIITVKEGFKGGGTVYKLDIHVMAGQKYVIRTGAGTVFARGFVLALKKLIEDHGVEVLKDPITISVSPGEEKVTFCGVYHNNQKVIPKWDGEVKLLPLIRALQEKLGVVVQTEELLENPDKYWELVKAQRK